MIFTRALTLIVLTCISLGSSGSALAQTEADVIAAVRTQIGANRQALVAANLGLAEGESEDFWPLYREYHNERDKLMDRRMVMLKDFSENFDGITDEKSAQIIEDYFNLEEDILNLKKKYVKKFRKILPDKQTLRYFQIENKIDAILNSELTQIVPLAE